MSYQITKDARDKVDLMLDDFFDGKERSFKACYQQITGDTLVTGQLRNAVKLQASIQSDTFSELLGDAVSRKMVKEYNLSGLDAWRKITGEPVPLKDFRTQHSVRLGGYGDLPIVDERGAYEPLNTPADEEVTYSAKKRGGTEDITIEAVKNDDVGLIRKIPVKLARAASWTLYKFIFDFLKDNAVVYDGVPLFHVNHNNLGSSALAKNSLQAGRLAMMKQTEAGSAEPINTPPRFIIVPTDLEDTAYELTVQPNLGAFSPTQADAIRRQTWEVIAVKNWIDSNDWFLASDPSDLQGIEIGFMDGNEEPEVLIQDNPSVGSMFSNDMMTFKIKHVYGAAVADYRAFYRGIVP